MKSVTNINPGATGIPAQLNKSGESDTKTVAKEIETVFMHEFLRIMMEQTSFGKDKTVSTYLPYLTSEMAKSFSERGIGIGEFLTRGLPANAKQSNNNEVPANSSSTFLSSPRTDEKITPPVEGKISSGFGIRHDPVDGKLRAHNGIDIAVPEGTPINPAAPGRVIFSGNSGGYGNCVVIEHENGLTSIYAHNSVNYAKAGDMVTKDTVISLSGSTGKSTGPHLHFEVRKQGSPVDPMGMFG